MSKLTVVTPTIPGREELLAYAKKSVEIQIGGPLPHFNMLDVEKVGPAMIRNMLVQKVETPWVLFLDDDDYLDPPYYKEVEPHLNEENDVVYTWCKRIGFNDNLDVKFDADRLNKRNFIPVTACVKVETFKSVGGFPEVVAHEDWGLWTKIRDVGGKFHLIEKKLWTYRRTPTSRNRAQQHAILKGVRPK